MKQRPHLKLHIPATGDGVLSICQANPVELRLWLDNLPKANLGEMARQLYAVLRELNQLRLSPALRLTLMELVRPEVYYVCQHLEKHFLHQCVVLEERPRKVAQLCQALQTHLVSGYKLVVVELCEHVHADHAELLTQAIERALHGLQAILLRVSQLYSPLPELLWLEIHQLYLIALEQRLQQPVFDTLARHCQSLTIEQIYKVCLLFSCASTNQLRQASLAQLSEILEVWAETVCLQQADRPAVLFAFSPQVDGPPRYKVLFQPEHLSQLIGLDTRPLSQALRAHLGGGGSSDFFVPSGLSEELLQYLQSAWGDIAERRFQRSQASGVMRICVGMVALHYYLSGEVAFEETLKSSKPVNPFQQPVDVWSTVLDAREETDWIHGLPLHAERGAKIQLEPDADEASSAPPCAFVELINQSPGGYCLAWRENVSPQLQAGELIGVCDSDGNWRVAVVRWLRQIPEQGTRIGVELLAASARPCGLQVIRKTDTGSPFLRALILPEISILSQPASLLAPQLPFQAGHKVQINDHGHLSRALLTARRSSTPSFGWFDFRILGGFGDPLAVENPAAQGNEDFDSLWKSL